MTCVDGNGRICLNAKENSTRVWHISSVRGKWQVIIHGYLKVACRDQRWHQRVDHKMLTWDESAGMNCSSVWAGLAFSWWAAIHGEIQAETWMSEWGKGRISRAPSGICGYDLTERSSIVGEHKMTKHQALRDTSGCVEQMWSPSTSPDMTLSFQVESKDFKDGQESLVLDCVKYCWKFKDEEDWWHSGLSSSMGVPKAYSVSAEHACISKHMHTATLFPISLIRSSKDCGLKQATKKV